MRLFIVVEGGCVRWVSSDSQEIEVEVIDLDDLFDTPDDLFDTPDKERKVLLNLADSLPRVW